MRAVTGSWGVSSRQRVNGDTGNPGDGAVVLGVPQESRMASGVLGAWAFLEPWGFLSGAEASKNYWGLLWELRVPQITGKFGRQ